MQSSSRVTISVFAIAAFLFGVASIALGVPFFWKQNAVVRNWPQAVAQVQRSEVVQIVQGGQQLWATRFELSFEADGKPVQATVKGYRQSFTREHAEEAARRFAAGQPVIVRYDPADPTEIRLDTDQPMRYYQLPIALALTGAIFIGIAMALFYVTKL